MVDETQFRWLVSAALVTLAICARYLSGSRSWMALGVDGFHLAAFGLMWTTEKDTLSDDDQMRRYAYLIMTLLLPLIRLGSRYWPILWFPAFGLATASTVVAFMGGFTIVGGLTIPETVFLMWVGWVMWSSQPTSRREREEVMVGEEEESLPLATSRNAVFARAGPPPPVPQKWNVPLEELNSTVVTECNSIMYYPFPTIAAFIQTIDAKVAPSSIKVIGAGSFGVVYRVGSALVLKIQRIPAPTTDPNGFNQCINLEREAYLPETLGKGQFARTLPFAAFQNKKLVYLLFSQENGYQYAVAMLMPFMDGGDAAKYVYGNPKPFKFVWNATRFLHNVVGLWTDLYIMHMKLNLVHSDIKPANLLLETSSGLIYLADYGLTCYAGPRQSPSKLASLPSCTAAGTPMYKPFWTLLQNTPLTYWDDVFALGASLIEITVSHPLWSLDSRGLQLSQQQLAALYDAGYLQATLDFVQAGRQLLSTTKDIPTRKQLTYALTGLIYMANPFSTKVRPEPKYMIDVVQSAGGGPLNPNIFNVYCDTTSYIYQILDGRKPVPSAKEWANQIHPQAMDAEAATNRCKV